MADPAVYRTRDEEKQWRTTRDPIALFEQKLKEQRLINDDEIAANNDRADATVVDAVAFAEESPMPSEDDLYADVMVDPRGAIAWRTRPSTPRE